ncbi:LADA_0A04324g1_1 [Lachancea dasiensis]|uniref:LADA_0A04324g1_1 n=1 Tax=Lachancea dasiensis TaxID=1072105 RepID=A0A1G4INE3_9SACH|nr:LADA_0A04324g1_1 [Lachancea dasiensis]
MAQCDYLVYQNNDVKFYIPIVFKESPTFDKVVPCCVADVVRGYKKWEQTIKRYYPAESEFWMLGNYPMNKIMICGRAVSWKWKFISGLDHAMFKIDDCSRESPENSTLLGCKCSKSLILQSGLPLSDLSGWGFILYGVVNRFLELEVQKIEIMSNMVQEVDFWRSTVEWREKLSDPWVVDADTMRSSFSQDDLLNRQISYNFVQHLELQAYQRELQISEGQNIPLASPKEISLVPSEQRFLEVDCCESPSHTKQELLVEDNKEDDNKMYERSLIASGSSNALRASDPDHGTRSHVQATNESNYIQGSVKAGLFDVQNFLAQGRSNFDLPPQTAHTNNGDKRPVILHSELRHNGNGRFPSYTPNVYLKSLVEYILQQPAIEVSTLSAFCEPHLTMILRSLVSQRECPIEELTSTIFRQALETLADWGLIRFFAQGRILNLATIKKLATSVSQRLSALVTLRLNTGKFEFTKLCYSVHVEYQSPMNAIFMAILKRELRKMVQRPNQTLLTSWWIEVITVNSVVVHFEYAREPIILR